MRPARNAAKSKQNLNTQMDETARAAPLGDSGSSAAEKRLKDAENTIIEVASILEIFRAVDLTVLNHPNRIAHLDGVGVGFQYLGALLSSQAMDAADNIARARLDLGLVTMSGK